MTQFGQPTGGEGGGLLAVQLGAELSNAVDVVRGLEGRHEEERLHPGGPHRVFEFSAPIGRVDVHQYRADPSRRQLELDPLDRIGGPDAHSIAALDAEGQQPLGQTLDLGEQLGVGQPLTLPARDDGLALRSPSRDIAEEGMDRQADQRSLAASMDVGECVAHGRNSS